MATKVDRRGGKKGGQQSRASRRSRAIRRPQMPFSKRNYALMAIGMLLVVIGYTVMRVENEVDGFISLYIAPVLLLIGYLEIIYAIWWRPKEKETAAGESQ
jgi:hypothetical protein